jgi:hypothetical protein
MSETLNRAQAVALLSEMMQECLQAFDASEAAETHMQERKWLIKKADTHPKLVEQAMRQLVEDEGISHDLARLKIEPETLSAAALLHDLGRLKEVDVNTCEIRLFQNYCPYTHSEISYEILRSKGVDDPQILLPVRYHDRYHLEKGLGADGMFLACQPAEQEQLVYMWRLLIDADRLGNLMYIKQHSFRGMVEEISPRYHSEAMISAEMKRLALQKHVFTTQDIGYEKTFADVLVRCMANINICHFEASKKIIVGHCLDALYGHLCAELEQAPGTEVQRVQALQDAKEIFEFYRACD